MCYFMADGIAIWEILFKYQYSLFFRLMLLPFDSIPWQMLWPMVSGRCYTTEADVIAYCMLI